jgi:uncharacterized membrane protein YvbJ
MKYCPYCGAILSDNTVSFCLQCKKEVTGVEEPVQKNKTRKNKKRTPEIKKEPIGVGYGDYYADVKPEDADRIKKTKNKDNLWIKLSLLAFAVILIVSACVIIAFLL